MEWDKEDVWVRWWLLAASIVGWQADDYGLDISYFTYYAKLDCGSDYLFNVGHCFAWQVRGLL